MEVIPGIDIGGSITKIAGLQPDGSVLSMLRVRAECRVTSLYGEDKGIVVTMGTGTAFLYAEKGVAPAPPSARHCAACRKPNMTMTPTKTIGVIFIPKTLPHTQSTRPKTDRVLSLKNYSLSQSQSPSQSHSSSMLSRSNSSFSPQLGQMTSPSFRMDSSKKISSSQVGQVVA